MDSKMAVLMIIILIHCVFIKITPGIFVNLALGKPVNVSSRHLDRDPSITVDGDIIKAVDPSGVMHTAENQSSAWWTVDLQTIVQDPTVKIYFRTDYKIRRNGLQLYTSTPSFPSYPGGQLCYTVTGDVNGRDIPDAVSVNCSGTWRYLMVYTDTDNDGVGAILDFGEVRGLGCAETYGHGCAKSCSSRKCAVTPTSCDRYTGACPPRGCVAGWTGTDCTEVCSRGVYGANCNMTCRVRHCAVIQSCDQFDGVCPMGCEAGWKGNACTNTCPPGTYGENCSKLCSSRHCVTSSDICDHVTGVCLDGCEAGWMSADCTQIAQDSSGCEGPGSAAAYVIGTLAGAIVMLLVGIGLHMFLIRTGRLEWMRMTKTGDSAQMSDVSHEVPEPVISEVDSNLNTDYSGLGVKSDEDYESIENKNYENI